jgi:UDP-N-acetylglucosamine acyltransferase
MANSHVGHDCHVGNDVIFANCATLGGHCSIGDNVFIGGLSAVHQFTRIGANAFISGVAGVRADVIPFGLAVGAVARLGGINSVGMRRRKFPAESVRAVRRAYRMLFYGPGRLVERLDSVEQALGQDAAVGEIVAFIKAARNRHLCQPRGRLTAESE